MTFSIESEVHIFIFGAKLFCLLVENPCDIDSVARGDTTRISTMVGEKKMSNICGIFSHEIPMREFYLHL